MLKEIRESLEKNKFVDCLQKGGDLGDLGERVFRYLKQEEKVTEEIKDVNFL